MQLQTNSTRGSIVTFLHFTARYSIRHRKSDSFGLPPIYRYKSRSDSPTALHFPFYWTNIFPATIPLPESPAMRLHLALPAIVASLVLSIHLDAASAADPAECARHCRRKDFSETWPFAPHLLRLLEEQVLISVGLPTMVWRARDRHSFLQQLLMGKFFPLQRSLKTSTLRTRRRRCPMPSSRRRSPCSAPDPCT